MILAWPTSADRPAPYAREQGRAKKDMTVTDSSEHAEAGESTLLPVAGRANVRYISFFLVMWELLPVGRLAVRVSP